MAEALLLVIEDSDEDVEAINRAVSRSHPAVRLEFLRSGAEAGPRLADPAERRPSLILLDLNMPGEGGLSVLTQVRARPELDAVPIVVFTSSTEPTEAEACYAAGADSYIYKPINFALFQTVLRGTLDYWLTRSASAGNVAQNVVPPPSDSVAQT